MCPNRYAFVTKPLQFLLRIILGFLPKPTKQPRCGNASLINGTNLFFENPIPMLVLTFEKIQYNTFGAVSAAVLETRSRSPAILTLWVSYAVNS